MVKSAVCVPRNTTPTLPLGSAEKSSTILKKSLSAKHTNYSKNAIFARKIITS